MIFLPILMAGCSSKKDLAIWSNATFDNNILKVPVYAQLDKQKELFSMLEKQDSLSKRTSDVEYSSGQAMSAEYLKFNNCRAHYYHSDTLSINIGIGTGFGGKGFIILYKDGKFYTKPYFFTDVITGEPDPTYKIVYQKLILDKTAYKTGDSLYGYINFQSIETDNNRVKTEHWGKGYFRTRITEL
ncbi:MULTISPECIES: hypothetical protein [Niastella]|uniref:hypothetical protein n=1 Tax=Niastella TaxID=354354 RepID=UPI001ADA4728|nr:hypothetical protein [Niastella soli]